MPPRRPARPVPPDVDVLRAGLAQGKIVRVGIAPSDQFPDGVTGRVRRIGDAAVDGDEFLFVEVPAGGAKDVLPFAAKDLTATPPRVQRRGPTERRALAERRVPADSPVAAERRGSAGSESAAAEDSERDALFRAGANQAEGAARTGPASPVHPMPPAQVGGARRSASGPGLTPPTRPRTTPAADTAQPSADPPAVAGESAARNPGRAVAGPRGKRAPITISISTAGDESAAWRIQATIGARTTIRPTTISPARVWEIVQSLGEPKLSELVRSLLDDHRRNTQARADALAAELSDLQAELKSFPVASSDFGRPKSVSR